MKNKSENLRISMDVFPYEKSLHRICDYSGIQIYAKTSLPLFIYSNGEIRPLAASTYEWTSDREILKIKLKDNIFWTDGTRVLAEDYIRAIEHITYNKKNRLNTLPSDVARIWEIETIATDKYEKSQSSSIGIELKHRNSEFLHYLTPIGTSPLHRTDDRMTAGPYQLVFIDENKISLEANGYFQLDPSKRIFKKIDYFTNRLENEYNNFLSKKIDVTCDTNISYDEFLRARGDPLFNETKSSLLMLLTAGKDFHSLPQEVKNLLCIGINRENLSRALLHLPLPAKSYLDLYIKNKTKRTVPCESRGKLHNNFQITIAFEDFYPNRIVIEKIAEQLLPYNIKIKSMTDNYGEWVSHSHLRLEIRSSIGSTAAMLYKSDISRNLLASNDFMKSKEAYSYIIQGKNSREISRCYEILDKMLQEAAVSIPLLIMPTGFFARQHIQADSIFRVGSFVCKSNYSQR